MPVTTRSGRSAGQSSSSTSSSSTTKKRKATPSNYTNNPTDTQQSPSKSKKQKMTSISSSTSNKQTSTAADKPTTTHPINNDSRILTNPPRSTAKEIGLTEPLSHDAKTLFALFLAADLSSARINHDIAFKSTRKLIEHGWDDVKALQRSSWEERTEALTEGGYTRYRERTATFLGEVADVLVGEYDGDLSNLFKAANGDVKKTRELLKKFKGMGDVGVDIFLRDAQIFYEYLVPFADKKALKAAEKAGIGKTAKELYDAVGNDVVKLSALCTSLVIEG